MFNDLIARYLKPRINLAAAKTRNGLDVLLYKHDDAFGISIGGKELMHSKVSASEAYLGKIGVEHLDGRMQSRVLVGGLGLGFTLRSVLENVSQLVKIDLVEIIPEIINWNKTFLHDLNGYFLNDSRVNTQCSDVVDLISKSDPRSFDGIILDLDNGPVAMVDKSNTNLYSDIGIKNIKRVLKNNGRLSVWSAASDLNFEKVLQNSFSNFYKKEVKPYGAAKRARHLIYIIENN